MKTHKTIISPILFFFASLFFFFCDVACFAFFEKFLVYSLLCFYLLSLRKPMNLARIIFCCFLLSLLPLLQYGRFGLNLLYIVPATLIAVRIRHLFYESMWQWYALLVGCLLFQTILIEYLILNLAWSSSYTLSLIIANMIILRLMSLKS